MASDPERPIEKLLRSCAEKRREDAGPPLELHPATRRVLQDEAARQFGKPVPREFAALGVLRRLWPRLVLGLAGAAVVFALIAVLRPSQPAPEMLARNDVSPALQQTEPEAKAALSAPVPVAGLADSSRGSESVPASSAGSVALREQTQSTLALNSPANSSAPAAPPPMQVSPPEAQSSPALAYDDLSAKRPAGGALEGAALSRRYGLNTRIPETLSKAKKDVTEEKSWTFVQTVQPKPGLTDKLGTAQPLLASFEVQQSGQNLKVVDRDGSVYRGYWQNSPIAAAKEEALKNTAAFSLARGLRSADAPKSLSDAELTNTQASSNYFFQVTGTNVTLNQQVVFTGNFSFPATNESGALGGGSNLDLNWALAQQGTNFQMTNLPLLNSRISGKARLDDRREIEINALPAKP